MFEFHVSRLTRDKYNFDKSLFGLDGNIIFANFLEVRKFAQKINLKRDLINNPDSIVHAGDINALGLMDEIFHLVFLKFQQNNSPKLLDELVSHLTNVHGEDKIINLFTQFLIEFPPVNVYNEITSVMDYIGGSTNGRQNASLVIEEIIFLWIVNQNPAVGSLMELFNDSSLAQNTNYSHIIHTIRGFFKSKPYFGPENQDLISMLRSPAIAVPHSLSGQLDYIREKWGALIGDLLYRLLAAIDMIQEETRVIIPLDQKKPSELPIFTDQGGEENFTPDSDWMPYTVMIAKNTYVWLNQLSKTYQKSITSLDQIPNEELEKLANWGFNGLWLIGLWERSTASKRIKQLCGNPEAVASAYSLKNYTIAADLGGEIAYQRLKQQAGLRGIRLASDMVPNHMGIDSDWVIEHPEWFVSQQFSPFPSYSFNGPDLSPNDQIGLIIDDHYYQRTDAAVVFKRVDYKTGENIYIYHGNDGTSMPWNDTAQLNYLNAEVREAVIQTILHVARKFPIIRFDAAMTLAKKHYQRLWFPQPGSGGAIPSRSEHAMTQKEFDNFFPKEFWREVVDRVTDEVPNTLLLAEAFWLMEGYFVRTLGMHRVYNSAFMNMLRNEENQKYRQLIKNTLEFDPQILKRYVNFMNNPDEKTAAEQFGKGDKYFGICTLLSTMPGLPMFGHGQIEGFAEKYGMEYYRPYWDEDPDEQLIQRHKNELFPLLKRRDLFAGVENFLLFDFHVEGGAINENIFAYINGNGSDHALVVYQNSFQSSSGFIQFSSNYLDKDTGNFKQMKVSDALGIKDDHNHYLIFSEPASGLEYIRSSKDIINNGLYFELNAYEKHVFWNFGEVEDNLHGHYQQLCNQIGNRGVPNIDQAIKELFVAPVMNPLKKLCSIEQIKRLKNYRLNYTDDKLNPEILKTNRKLYEPFIEALGRFINGNANTSNIIDEHQISVEVILNLLVFAEFYDFNNDESFFTSIEFIQAGLLDNAHAWDLLFIWNDLRLMGKAASDGLEYAEIGRAWLEEWGMTKHIRQVLVDLGLKPEEVEKHLKLIKILVQHQNWMLLYNYQSSNNLVESWLSDQDICSYLLINRYQDNLYFNEESFESLAWWLVTVGLVNVISTKSLKPKEKANYVKEGYDLILLILEAKETAGYQVNKLLEGLK